MVVILIGQLIQKDNHYLMNQMQVMVEQFGVKYALEPYAGQILPVDADIAGDGDGDV